MPAPVVLRPTPQRFLDHSGAFRRPGPLPLHEVLRDAKWFATIPDAVALEAVQCLLDDMDAYLLDPSHQPDQDAMAAAFVRAGSRHLFFGVADRFYALTSRGIDPTVLLALRGTRLTHAARIAVSRSGLTPAEAHDRHAAGTLDLDAIHAMTALRHS